MSRRTALEFFSGIGAFSQAATRRGIEVLAAYDQSEHANRVFAANNAVTPNSRNLDTIPLADIPPADMWWLSPPCKPYTVRGKRRDDADTRAASLKRLIDILPQRRPDVLLLENVAAFQGSAMHGLLAQQLQQLGFCIESVKLCPTNFGVPMRRPRFFLIACAPDAGWRWQAKLPQPTRPVQAPLHSYLDAEPAAELFLSQETLDRYIQGFDIVDAGDAQATAICFTSGYARCMKVGGSMIRDTTGNIRHFSPREMLRLFGFPEDFQMPQHISLDACFRLIGNSVDVRCIDYLLDCLSCTEYDTNLAASRT